MQNLSLLLGTTFILSLSTLVGCGGSVETSGGAGGGTTTSSTTGSVGTGGAASTSSTGVGGGSLCGGFAGATCAATEYCDYPVNTCGAADEQGTCKPRPTACDKNLSPTCACDGTVYGNSCEAMSAGFDVNDNGSCKAEAGKFACGSSFCEAGVTYCRRQISDVGGEPSTYECISLPPLCGSPPTCACLANQPCGDSCVVVVEGGFKVSCPGG